MSTPHPRPKCRLLSFHRDGRGEATGKELTLRIPAMLSSGEKGVTSNLARDPPVYQLMATERPFILLPLLVLFCNATLVPPISQGQDKWGNGGDEDQRPWRSV